MKKFIIKLLVILFIKPSFWVFFWVLYGIFFWIIYKMSFGSIFEVIRDAMIGVIYWASGGIIGGVIGIIGSMIFWSFGEEITKKTNVTLEILFWTCFWAIFWTYFLSFLAGIVGLRAEVLLLALGVTAYSSIPITIFGATGGAIGGWISKVYDRKFSEES